MARVPRGALVGAAVALLIGLDGLPLLARTDVTFRPSLIAVILLLRIYGLAPASAAALIAAVVSWLVFALGPMELVWAAHPLFLLALMRIGMPTIVAQACATASVVAIRLLQVDLTSPLPIGQEIVMLQLAGGLLGGWATGAFATVIETVVPEFRQRAARRFGMAAPDRRLADVAAGFATVPIMTLLLVNGVEARRNWLDDARRMTEAVATRASDALTGWWLRESLRRRAAGQEILDRYFGYRGLPPLLPPDQDAGISRFRDPALNEFIPSYVASQSGEILALGAPTVIPTTEDVTRNQAAVVAGPLLRAFASEGTAGLEMLIPIRRDNDTVGHVWALYSQSELRRTLPVQAQEAGLMLTDGGGHQLFLGAESPKADWPPHIAPSNMDSLFLTRDGDSAVHWSMGVVQLSTHLSLPGNWYLVTRRPIADIVAAGARHEVDLMAIVLVLVVGLDLISRRLAGRLVARLATAAGPTQGIRRDSLINELTEAIHRQATELQARAAAADEALARQETIIASAPVVLFALRPDAHGRLMPSYLSSGAEAWLGRPVQDLMTADNWAAAVDHDPFLTRVDADISAAPRSRERAVRHVDGRTRRMQEEVTVIGGGTDLDVEYVGVWIDIEERRRSEEKVMEASRLVALGEMATGMAHELNQPLNVIRLAAENLGHRLRQASLPEELQAFVDTRLKRLSDQAQRAAGIIDRMRISSRSRNGDERYLSLNAAVEAAVETTAEALRSSDIELDVEFDASDPHFIGPDGALDQILINILINARDAIVERRGHDPSEKVEARVRLTVSCDAAWICVRIADTGGGIPEAIMGRLFDPFFTTKPTGKGIGLGLAISYGLAGDLGGELSVENGTDGAIFILTVPHASPVTEGKTAV